MPVYYERMVYDAIEDMEPVQPRAIRDLLGLSPSQMDGALRRLFSRGCLLREGSTHKIRYSIRPGVAPPKDRRGWHPNSRIALRVNWRITEASMRNLRPGWKPGAQRKPKEAWQALAAWVPVVSQVDDTN